MAHELSLAQRRADECEERLQALQAKHAEGLKSSQRLASELQQARPGWGQGEGEG